MILGRSRRHDSGQALAEYGIVLALVTGLNWVSHLTDTIRTAEPLTLLLAGAAGVGVVAVGYAFRR